MVTREQSRAVENREGWGSLDEWQTYAQLVRRMKVKQRRWHVIAISPFAIVIFFVFGFSPKSENDLLVEGTVVASLVWALVIRVYSMALTIRIRAIRCPKCHAHFGSEDECMSCRIPRHLVTGDESR